MLYILCRLNPHIGRPEELFSALVPPKEIECTHQTEGSNDHDQNDYGLCHSLLSVPSAQMDIMPLTNVL